MKSLTLISVCLTGAAMILPAPISQGAQRLGVAAFRGVSHSAAWERRSFGWTWQDVLRRSDNPSHICAAVRHHITYKPDMETADEWLGGRKTWAAQQGDCEDFAACVKELCAAKGFHADMYVFTSKTQSKSHAATIGHWNGKMWMSSNGSFEYIASLSVAQESVASEMGWQTNDVVFRKVVDSFRF